MEFLVKLIAFLFMAWLVVMLVLLVLSAIVNVKRAADRTFEQLSRRDDGDPDP